jgi:hypothetical protein
MKYIFLFCFLAKFACGFEPTREEKAEMLAGLARWESFISESDTLPREEAILKLSQGLLKTTIGSVYVVPERIVVREKLQMKLLAIPGHADYWGDKIKAYPRSTDRTYWYQYLQNLPSPETVGVLGGLLSDESERPPMAEDLSNLDQIAWVQPNCDRAARALTVLLAKPPNNGKTYEWNRDLETWRLWWERVKAGNQTFRFAGDDTEYDLRGPVKRGGSEDRSRGAKRPTLGSEKDTQTKRVPPLDRAFPYLICGLFLLAGLFFYLRGKRSET